MIQRRVLTGPIEPFDFFNDYNDTRRWLQSLRTEQATQVAEELRLLYIPWNEAFWKRLKKV